MDRVKGDREKGGGSEEKGEGERREGREKGEKGREKGERRKERKKGGITERGKREKGEKGREKGGRERETGEKYPLSAPSSIILSDTFQKIMGIDTSVPKYIRSYRALPRCMQLYLQLS